MKGDWVTSEHDVGQTVHFCCYVAAYDPTHKVVFAVDDPMEPIFGEGDLKPPSGA